MTEVVAICDAIMRAQRQDIGNADGLRQVGIDLRNHAYPALAALYALSAAR